MTKQEFLDLILQLNAQSVEVFAQLVDQIEVEPAPKKEVISLKTYSEISTDIVTSLIKEEVYTLFDIALLCAKVRSAFEAHITIED